MTRLGKVKCSVPNSDPFVLSNPTVDGQNPAPVGTRKTARKKKNYGRDVDFVHPHGSFEKDVGPVWVGIWLGW